MLLRVDIERTSKFSLRTRPASEKLVDIGFKNIVVAMASMVAVVLFSIFAVVYYESTESISRYGLRFLFSSAWNPVTDEYGAFTAIYGTLFTSIASVSYTHLTLPTIYSV